MKLRLIVLLACAGLLVAGLALAYGQGEVGPGNGLTANGHQLHPVGRITTVGNFPTGSAVTPDSRFFWVIDCGHGSDDVRIMSVATGGIIQTLPLPGCYGGIAIAPDGKHAYVGGTPKGSSPTEGPTQGDAGDVIHVFSIDSASGMGTEQTPLVLPSTTGGSARMNALPPVSGVGSAYPEGLALSPDGATLAVTLNGADKLVLISLASGQMRLAATGAYPAGVAFDRHGRVYVSNEFDGTLTVVDVASGAVTATLGGLGGAQGDKNSHPEGIAVDPVVDRIYVAVTNRDQIAVVDTGAVKLAGSFSVGRPEGIGTAPVKLSVSPDGHMLYAADSGEDSIAAISLTPSPGLPGSSTSGAAGSAGTAGGASAVARAFALAPSLTSLSKYFNAQQRASRKLARVHGAKKRRAARRAYTRTLLKLRARYLRIGGQSGCSGPTPLQAQRYGSAVLHALHITQTKALRRGQHLTRKQRRSRRALLAKRRRLLAAARRALPALKTCSATGAGTAGSTGTPGSVVPPSPGSLQVLGRIPTAAYPTDVEVTPDGSQLLWVSGKGLGAGPNPTYSFDGDKRPGVTPNNIYGTYVLDKLLGQVGQLPTPTDQQLQAYSPAAAAQSRPSNPEAQPPGNPVPAPGNGPSAQIKHVFYIVKENRTYDQVFGSDPRGNGDPSLELFDDNGVAGPVGGITPNAHALTRTFPLLDNFYADSEVSVDGHIITSSGYATDYVQKALTANYSNRNRGMDFGIYPVTFPPNDFLFDQAVRQGVSFRNYGELGAGNSPLSNDGRPTYPAVAANTDNSYPNNIFIGCLQALPSPANLAVCTQDSAPSYKGTGKLIGSQSRVNTFVPELNSQVSSGTVPALNYMILPNDHTNGTTPNDYTPQAMVADNDLALGQIVDAISHSAIWSSSAIVVVEDDSQDGADHVDAHRMPAYVISPWAKRGGAVVHTRFDQYSALRTVELILGLNPLSLTDALATPMYDAFDSTSDPNGTIYNAIAPTQDIGQVNGPHAAMAATSKLLPWSKIDAVPQEISDQILFRAVHGAHARVPAPGPNASPAEAARAQGVRAALRAHPGRAITAAGGDG